ncbi:transposase [Bacillus sp. 1NLA3E]|nr:transposase [Bacillus sp. 1NLA3E]
MSKRIFTEKEIKLLSANNYVKSVSSKGITYTEEFKHIFIAENENGKQPREIFEECGFDIDIIGMDRVRGSGKRWRANYRQNGVSGLRDTRKGNSGRPSERELSIEEKYVRLEAQNNLLRAENELLKKIRLAGKRMKKK